jgi:hypothetical protein
MGHASIVTTMCYIHATDQGKRSAIVVLSEYRQNRRHKLVSDENGRPNNQTSCKRIFSSGLLTSPARQRDELALTKNRKTSQILVAGIPLARAHVVEKRVHMEISQMDYGPDALGTARPIAVSCPKMCGGGAEAGHTYHLGR